MKQPIYAEFDKLMSDRNKKIKAFSSRYKTLKSEADKNAVATFYGKESLYLGHFCPSLIIDKTSNFKRDTLKKTLGKNAKKYASYELDKNGALLRMKEVNQFGTVFETYIIRDKNEEFSITFWDGKESTDTTVRAVYDADNKILRSDFISEYDLRSELYSYAGKNADRIKCTKYYYVPELNGSDKSKKPGYTNSPARWHEIDIVMNTDRQIQRLEYGEVINGKREVSFVYENDK